MDWLNGNKDAPSRIDLGSKNKYQRMQSEHGDVDENFSGQDLQQDDANSSRKYVMACAFFASLNSVLLGYGMLSLCNIRDTLAIPLFNFTWILICTFDKDICNTLMR